MFVAYVVEQFFPRIKLPYKKGWFERALIFNLLQLVTVIGFSKLIEPYIIIHMENNSLFHLNDYNLHPFYIGGISYLVNTFIFYWWHRARHEIPWMWNCFHQFHHAPERIEVITSFYKHPLEIIGNSILITILLYPILGVKIEDNIWFTFISAVLEFFYHINITTPYWLGFIIQRPESHRLHHLRDKIYCKNYSDLPVWDMLFGTFENPKEDICKTGFSNDGESKIKEMLKCKRIIGLNKKSRRTPLDNKIIYGLLIIGLLSTIGYILHIPIIRQVGFMTGSSPLPLVFSSYNGHETFSTQFNILAIFNNGYCQNFTLDHKMYGRMKGPYNRKNMYGVLFSHGPFFSDPDLIELRDEVLRNGFCQIDGRFSGYLPLEFGIKDKLLEMTIIVKSITNGLENKTLEMTIKCE